MRSRACPAEFAAPGKQASGLFSARTARQPLEIRRCERNICQGVVWRGRSPSILNPQQRHARCEDEFLRSVACGAGAKILTLRLCRPGVPQGRQAKARGFPKGGSEGPENRPVACFHRRTGRQALVVSPFRGLCNSPVSMFLCTARIRLPAGTSGPGGASGGSARGFHRPAVRREPARAYT